MTRICLAGALVVLVATGCEKGEETEAADKPDKSTEPVEQEPEPPPEPPPTFMELDLAGALADLKPEIVDSVDNYSDGQLKLTLWATKKLSWDDVDVAKNETSAARIKKDSEPEIGKRMCLKGRIVQIWKEDANGEKVFRGLIRQGYKPTSFIAVGSTGDLVEKSRARFCGLVAGNYAFQNVGGGQTQTVLLIGMFDLAENHGNSAEAN
jgi:hypothetical protein